jgi:hypothetical protein
MKPFTNRHSIAAGSPVHMGGSYKKSPLEQDVKTGDEGYTNTEFKTGLGGEQIATRRTASTPGAKVVPFSSDPTEAAAQKQYWIDNPEAKIKHDEAKLPTTVTQQRDVEVKQPKLRVNIFKGYRGSIPDEIKQADSLSFKDQVGVAKSINMDPNVFRTEYTKRTGRKIKRKPKTTTSSSSGSQNISEWTSVD